MIRYKQPIVIQVWNQIPDFIRQQKYRDTNTQCLYLDRNTQCFKQNLGFLVQKEK